MALDNFIPEVWSARLIRALRADLIWAQEGIVNRDFEGEIREFGDTVHVMGIGPVTVNNYAKNTDIAAPQELQDTAATIIIDQAKYFHFQVDDVDQAQMRPQVMDAAMDESSFALSNVADTFVSTKMAAGVPAAQVLGTEGAPIAVTAVTAYEQLVNLKVILNEANIPPGGRWVVVPPWYVGLLEKDDRFVKGATAQAMEVIRNGFAGSVAGMVVLESNNTPNNGTWWKLIAGTSMAFTYAEQIRKVEAYRPERRFADAVKGLHLYGGQVFRPESLAMLIADRP